MEARVIAGRYAQALFDTLTKEDWDRAISELSEVAGYFTDHDSVRKLCASPLVPLFAKQKTIDIIIGKGVFHPDVESFFHVLLKKGRLSLLDLIIDEFKETVQRKRNLTTAKIWCSMKMPNETQKKIIQVLGDVCGQNLESEVVTDQSLLCGILAQVGNTIYDFSLKHKLEKLGRQLQQ